jgi:hypothetical protein
MKICQLLQKFQRGNRHANMMTPQDSLLLLMQYVKSVKKALVPICLLNHSKWTSNYIHLQMKCIATILLYECLVNISKSECT